MQRMCVHVHVCNTHKGEVKVTLGRPRPLTVTVKPVTLLLNALKTRPSVGRPWRC